MTASGYVIIILILLIMTALVMTPACCHIAVVGAGIAVWVTQFKRLTNMVREYMADELAQTETSDLAQEQEQEDRETNLDDKKWDNKSEVSKLFSSSTDETRVSGDDRLMAKALEIADRDKQAKLARTRFTSDNFRRYFEEELNEQENRHWWDHDELDAAMDKKYEH